MGTGRPKKDEVNIKELKKMAPYLNMEQCADYFGISYSTLNRQCQDNPALLEAYKEGRANAIGSVASSLVSKARGGDVASMIFYLKTQAGWREKDRPEELDKDLKHAIEIVRVTRIDATETD